MIYHLNEDLNMATRRQLTSEFKLEIVKMVIDQGASIGKLSKASQVIYWMYITAPDCIQF